MFLKLIFLFAISVAVVQGRRCTCGIGWRKVGADLCIYTVRGGQRTRQTWRAARRHCQQLGADLATFRYKEEYKASTRLASCPWIGVRKIDGHLKFAGSGLDQYTNLEPSVGDGCVWGCLYGGMRSMSYDYKNDFICGKRICGNRCGNGWTEVTADLCIYVVHGGFHSSSGYKTWQAARNHCKRLGGDLATFRTRGEFSAAAKLDSCPWIGIRKVNGALEFAGTCRDIYNKLEAFTGDGCVWGCRSKMVTKSCSITNNYMCSKRLESW